MCQLTFALQALASLRTMQETFGEGAEVHGPMGEGMQEFMACNNGAGAAILNPGASQLLWEQPKYITEHT